MISQRGILIKFLAQCVTKDRISVSVDRGIYCPKCDGFWYMEGPNCDCPTKKFDKGALDTAIKEIDRLKSRIEPPAKEDDN